MSPDNEHIPDDEEIEDYAPRSIFAAGWFRAVLVLTVVAITVVVALPYLLNWFEPEPPTPPARQESAAPAAPTPAAPAATPDVGASTAAPPPSPPAAVPPTAAKPAPPTPRPELPPRPAAPPAVASRPAPSEPARRAPAVQKPSAAASAGKYWVQVGLFRDERNATDLARKLRADGFSVDVTKVTRTTGSGSSAVRSTFQVVRAGAFPDERRAGAARDRLKAKGYAGFVTQGPAK